MHLSPTSKLGYLFFKMRGSLGNNVDRITPQPGDHTS